MSLEQAPHMESSASWMPTSRLFEAFLFTYVLFLAGFTFIGLLTFGFLVPGFSRAESLLFNFLWFLILITLMAFTPTWHRLIFKYGIIINGDYILKKIADIENPEERKKIHHLCLINGALPLSRLQWVALWTIFAIFNFEIMFISSAAFITPDKDYQLVWQPDWATAVIEWIRSHLTLPPYNVDRDLFMFSMRGTEWEKLDLKIDGKPAFPDVMALLNTKLADVGFFFHFFKSIFFFINCICYSIIFWRMLDWLGAYNVNPKNIKSFKKFIYISFISLTIVLASFVGSYGYFVFNPLRISFPLLMNKTTWIELFWYNSLYFFVIVDIKIILGWLIFWKNIFVKFYCKLKECF